MDNELIDAILVRLDRLEAMINAVMSPPDQSEAVAKMAKELATVKADIRNRDIEIRDLRSLVAAKTSPADVTASINKHIPKHIAVVGDFVADTVLDAQKSMRDELGDATRAISRDVERAEAAAAANIKNAAAVIGAWSAELGA